MMISKVFFFGLLGLIAVVNGQGQATWDQTLYNALTIVGLPENLPVGYYIGSLAAHLVNNTLQPIYSTSSNFFNVDPSSGNVTLKAPLSYLQNGPNFTAYFYASWPSISVQIITSTLVVILPVNHPPTFDEPSYSTSVKENAPVGSSIFNNIFVTDVDSGLNGTVKVSCIDPNQEATIACQTFSVSLQPVTAQESQVVISLLSPLSYAVKNVYTLVLQAQDEGTPPLSSNATVTINVENAQASLPVFQNTPYLITVQELTNSVPILLTIQAVVGNNYTGGLEMTITNDPFSFFLSRSCHIFKRGVFCECTYNGRHQSTGLTSRIQSIHLHCHCD